MADLAASPASRRWLWWLAEIGAAITAGVVAYIPLRHSDGGLALAITAAATVGYVGLTNEMTYLSRQQVRALERQLRQQALALAEARTQVSAELQSAQEAAATAERTVQESVRARYDASAPQVAIRLWGRVNCTLKDAATGKQIKIEPSHFLERDDAHNYTITVSQSIQLINYGPAAALVKGYSTAIGTIYQQYGITPDSWLLSPISGDVDIDLRIGVVRLNILTDVPLDDAALLIGASSDFGAKCSFQVSDLLNQVTDTHTLMFRFSAILVDGSRVRVVGEAVTAEAENGGVASVAREYRGL
jgi:hypothetical protein